MRSSHLAPVLLTLLVASTLGACSFFVDTDGLSGGDDASVTTDAATDTSTSPDVAPITDSAADARIDASSMPFCEANSGHALCLDFDESLSLPAADQTMFDVGSVFIDTATSVSAPNSFAVIFPIGTANEQIEKNLTPTAGPLAFQFDIKLEASDLTSGQIIPFDIDLPAGPGVSEHSFFFQDYYGAIDLIENVTPDDGGVPSYPSTTFASPIPNDTWCHVEVSIDGSTRAMTITYNGAVVFNGFAEAGFPKGTAYLTLGGYANNLPAKTTAHIDNVILDY